MKKFTPEPWHRHDLEIHCDNREQHSVVANVSQHKGINKFQADANARLLIEAPEMYALLKKIAQDELDRPYSFDVIARQISAINDLIARIDRKE